MRKGDTAKGHHQEMNHGDREADLPVRFRHLENRRVIPKVDFGNPDGTTASGCAYLKGKYETPE